MLVPVIRCLIEQNKDIKITVLSKAWLKPIFDKEFVGHNIHFHIADVTKKHKGFLGLFKLSKELKKLNITHIADTHNVLRSKVLRFFLFGIKSAKIDKGRKEKKALTRIENKVFKQLKTTHQRYADVFAKLGFKTDLLQHKFPPKPNRNKLDFIQIDEDYKKWIGIAPFAQYDSKMYPLELMEKVIEELNKTNRVFLFGGGKKEEKILSKIASKYNCTQSLVGKLNLKQELQFIANLDCMIAMDSGNAHFAAMFGVKTISVWGGTHPFAGFAPFMQQENCILPNLEKYPNLPCSIYGNKICEGYKKVMYSIEPQSIINKI